MTGYGGPEPTGRASGERRPNLGGREADESGTRRGSGSAKGSGVRGLVGRVAANRWVQGARPRTLPAAVVPVAVGTGVALAENGAIWWRAGLCLIVSLSFQIGVNYANDYSDGVRGTDAVRVGPVRLVASGLAKPRAVKRAAVGALAFGAAVGVPLAVASSLWLVGVGGAAVLAAWYYTGGEHPYGYAGFGEVFVFLFFGVVATVSTAFVQTEAITGLALTASLPVGLLACALLVVNNLRDIPGDTVAGKRTLAVRLGDPRTRLLYAVCTLGALGLVLPAAVLSGWTAAVGVLVVPLLVGPLRAVLVDGARGPALIGVLVATGRAQLAFGALFALGLALST